MDSLMLNAEENAYISGSGLLIDFASVRLIYIFFFIIYILKKNG